MKKTSHFASALRAHHRAGAGLLLGCILGVCATPLSAAPATSQAARPIESLEPDHADLNFICGGAFYEMKQYDQAGQYYQKTIDLNPEYAQAYNRLGDIQYTVKANYGEAEKLYSKALELAPGTTLYRKNMERSQIAQIKRPGLSGPQE